MKHRNNKGFTLIELLAVITILGIVAIISIVAVTRLINKSKDEQRNSQKKTAEMAAESYLQSNRKYLPKSIGETTTITIKNLREANYLKEDLVDGNGKNCMQKSYVVISKKSATQYTYKTYLYCGDEEPTEREQIATPTIDVNFYAYDDNNQRFDSSNMDPTEFLNKVSNPKYEIIITGGTKNGVTYKVDSYNYSISAVVYEKSDTIDSGKEVEVYSSGTLSGGKNATKVIIPNETTAGTVSGDLKDYIDITKVTNIKIHVIARNNKGVTYEKKVSLDSHASSDDNTVAYNDNEPPICDEDAVSSTPKIKNDNDWINKNNANATSTRKITIPCKDKGGSGCVRSKYTKTWPNKKEQAAEFSTITIEDNAKNKTDCRVRVNYDRIPPVVSIKAYKSKGSNVNVFADGVKLKTEGESSDTVSVEATKYNDLVGGSWMNAANYPNGVFYEVTITDNLSLKNFKWEVNGVNIKDDTSSKYKSLSVDNPNGIKTKTVKNGEYGCTSMKKCVFYISFENDGKRNGKFTVTDKAGNTAVYNLAANIDRKSPPKPTVKYYLDGTSTSYSLGTWTSKDVMTKPSVNASDDISGFNSFESYYKVNGTGNPITGVYTSNGGNGYKVSDSGRNTIQYRTKDNAGNYSGWNDPAPVYVDKLSPNPPTLTGYKTSVSNDNKIDSSVWENKVLKPNSGKWINTDNVVRATGSTDNLSGMGYYSVRATGNQTTSSTLKNFNAADYKVSNEGTTVIYVKACDAVGNCSSETKYTAMVDKHPPTEPVLYGCNKPDTASRSSCANLPELKANTWYRKYAIVTANGSTDTLSKGVYYIGKSSGAETNGEVRQERLNIEANGTTVVSFKACDAAGNCTGYKNFNVLLDNIPPTNPTVSGYRKSDNTAYPGSGLTDGWYSGKVTVKASGSSDTLSKDVKYYYTTTGATKNETNIESASRNIEAEGTSKIAYKACDKVGNCSESVSLAVKLDRTSPTCKISKTKTGSTSGVNISISCSDGSGASGCKKDNPKTDSKLKSDTTKTVKDNAGNKGTCKVSVSSEYWCDTCGGGSYTCYKYGVIATGVTNYYCFVTLGGHWRQDGNYNGVGGIGRCYGNISSTCYYPTYSCNCAYYYY